MINFIINFNNKSENVKIAWLSDLPRHVVDAIITNNILKSNNIHAESRAFSTSEAALNWLNVQL